MHAADASIGYLQPNSCRVGEWRDGTPYVVLPDVGFAWDKRAGLMMPNWIAEPSLPALFEHGAERRNEDYLAELGRQDDDRHLLERAKDAAARERADVKTLARLVAAALVGPDEIRRWAGDKKPLLKLPARNVATDTRAEVWDKVIAPCSPDSSHGSRISARRSRPTDRAATTSTSRRPHRGRAGPSCAEPLWWPRR